ncbi:hypothetical protein [Nocardiopsis valliformis]|uniref:hypothetical protein n=1 Tax=Nocardiopsis valliformis TaxID=239974 RepID=UPI00034AFFF0|nr:hypothetical protein [Nocardiopsis valliformis]
MRRPGPTREGTVWAPTRGRGSRASGGHFLRAHEQERLRGGARRVRILYQQLAATAEVGAPEQGDYERGVHFYLDIERTVHLLERWSRGVLLSEYPKLADELSRLVRPRPRALTTWSTRLTPARRTGHPAWRADRPGWVGRLSRPSRAASATPRDDRPGSAR